MEYVAPLHALGDAENWFRVQYASMMVKSESVMRTTAMLESPRVAINESAKTGGR
jgi:hypothetical protein